ncbi:hypothetical protein [Pseudomonas hormoni]
MENFRERITKEFESQGLRFFRETLWSSSLQRSDLPRIRYFLQRNNFHGVDVALSSPPDDTTSRIKWSRHYDSSGQCISLPAPVVIPGGSNHLKLTFGYPNQVLRDTDRPKEFVVVNSLRLIFGVAVARELIVTSFFGVQEELAMHSDVGYASKFDIQSNDLFDDPPIQDSEVISIPEEAAFFLEKAFVQEFPSERFVLMWLAFEAIINISIEKGSTNGERRKTFFKEVLQSDVANAEVYRLFQLRCEIFKEGRASNLSIEDDCWSLYAALQLVILKNCEQRRAFLSAYETVILNRVLDS